MPVSYTHLDVYKRQYTGSMLEVSNTLGTNSEDITMGYYAASAGMAIAYPIIPVSYTHLDVYKRQIYGYSYFFIN